MTATLDFSTSSINYSIYYQIHGNAVLENAEVVCVTYIPTQSVRRKNDRLIDRIWKDHLVLVEYNSSDSKIEMGHRFRRVKTTSGWDIPYIEPLLRKWEDKEKILYDFNERVNSVRRHMNWQNYIMEGSEWKSFMKLMQDLFKGESDPLESILATSRSLREFKIRISPICLRVRRELRQQMALSYQVTFQTRLSSLQQTIKNALQLKRRVIVCLSPNFVICNPRLTGKCFKIQDFMAFLYNTKYVIINAKTSPLQIEDQAFLWNSQIPVKVPTLQIDNGGSSFYSRVSRPSGTSTDAHASTGVESEESQEEDLDDTQTDERAPYIWKRGGNKKTTSVRFKKNEHVHAGDFPKLSVDGASETNS